MGGAPPADTADLSLKILKLSFCSPGALGSGSSPRPPRSGLLLSLWCAGPSTHSVGTARPAPHEGQPCWGHTSLSAGERVQEWGRHPRAESPHSSCAPGTVLWVTPKVAGDWGLFAGLLSPRALLAGASPLAICGVMDSPSGPGHLRSSWRRRVVPGKCSPSSD